MRFLTHKVSGGKDRQNISRYCRWLGINRQGFYKFIKPSPKTWKHEAIAQEIRSIVAEDEWNDTYGKKRIFEALLLRHPDGGIPSITTIYRILTKMGRALSSSAAPILIFIVSLEQNRSILRNRLPPAALSQVGTKWMVSGTPPSALLAELPTR